jgi:hypothetical protein
MVKNIGNAFLRGNTSQKGQTLILALILLFFGTLIVSTLLTYMTSGLKTTGEVYNVKASELYAADAGIAHGQWKIVNGDIESDYSSNNFSDTPFYDLVNENINENNVNVSVQNIWIPFVYNGSDPEPLPTPSVEAARELKQEPAGSPMSPKITISSNVTQPYLVYENIPGKIEITIRYYPADSSEILGINSIGIWLPNGYTLPDDLQSNIESYADTTHITPYKGGYAVVWSFSDYPYKGNETTGKPGFPKNADGDPISSDENSTPPITSIITLNFTTTGSNLSPPLAWIKTGPDSDPDQDLISDPTITSNYTWDGNIRVYHIQSVAHNDKSNTTNDTQIDAYLTQIKSQVAKPGDTGNAIGGDYYAIGAPLLVTGSDESYKNVPVNPTVTIDNQKIPEDAALTHAFLYWSAWKNNNSVNTSLLNDDGTHFSGTTSNIWWNRSGTTNATSAWYQNGSNYTGHFAPNPAPGPSDYRYLTLKDPRDLSPYASKAGTVNIQWTQWISTLSSVFTDACSNISNYWTRTTPSAWSGGGSNTYFQAQSTSQDTDPSRVLTKTTSTNLSNYSSGTVVIAWDQWVSPITVVPLAPLLPDTCNNFNYWNNGSAWTIKSTNDKFMANGQNKTVTDRELVLKAPINVNSSNTSGTATLSFDQSMPDPAPISIFTDTPADSSNWSLENSWTFVSNLFSGHSNTGKNLTKATSVDLSPYASATLSWNASTGIPLPTPVFSDPPVDSSKWNLDDSWTYNSNSFVGQSKTNPNLTLKNSLNLSPYNSANLSWNASIGDVTPTTVFSDVPNDTSKLTPDATSAAWSYSNHTFVGHYNTNNKLTQVNSINLSPYTSANLTWNQTTGVLPTSATILDKPIVSSMWTADTAGWTYNSGSKSYTGHYNGSGIKNLTLNNSLDLSSYNPATISWDVTLGTPSTTTLFSDNLQNTNNWTLAPSGSGWSSYNINGDKCLRGRSNTNNTFTYSSTLDLSQYAGLGGSATIRWSQWKSGTLVSTDKLYCQISSDNFVTYSTSTSTIFSISDTSKPASNNASFSVPSQYLTSGVKIRFTFEGFTSPKYCFIDDINISGIPSYQAGDKIEVRVFNPSTSVYDTIQTLSGPNLTSPVSVSIQSSSYLTSSFKVQFGLSGFTETGKSYNISNIQIIGTPVYTSNDRIDVYVSTNGGTSYSSIASIQGPTFTNPSISIPTANLTTNFKIQLRLVGFALASKSYSISNIQIISTATYTSNDGIEVYVSTNGGISFPYRIDNNNIKGPTFSNPGLSIPIQYLTDGFKVQLKLVGFTATSKTYSISNIQIIGTPAYTSSDGVDVYVSTDGGSTFSTNPIQQIRGPTFTNPNISIPSQYLSANFKVQFRLAGCVEEGKSYNISNINISGTPAYTSADGLDFSYSFNNGTSWTTQQVFRGYYSQTWSKEIPYSSSQSQLLIKFSIAGFNQSGQYCYLDNIKLSEGTEYSSSDALFFAFSKDGGTTWSNYVNAFRGNNVKTTPTNFSYNIPNQYLTNGFKVKYMITGFRDSVKYCYIDNIKITPSYSNADNLQFSCYNPALGWSDPIQAFSGDIGSSEQNYSYPIPANYLTSGFKMRFYLAGFDDANKYCNIDDIKISVMQPLEAVQFKINDDLNNLTSSKTQILQTFLDPTNLSTPNGYSYSCFKDVTSIVKSALGDNTTGYANYSIITPAANMANTTESGGGQATKAYAGWSLIIVYTSPETQGHKLYLYDNFFYSDWINSTTSEINVDWNKDGKPGGTISGFYVPEPKRAQDGLVDTSKEPYAAKITCFVGEGDIQLSNDYLVIKRADGSEETTLWDGTSTTGNTYSSPHNVWNNTSIERDSDGNIISGTESSGVDVDTFVIPWGSTVSEGVLRPGDTSAKIDMYTQQDSWDMVYMIISFRSLPTTGGTLNYNIK